MRNHELIRARFDELNSASDEKLETSLGAKIIPTDELMEKYKVTVLYFGSCGLYPWEAYVSGDSHYVDTNPGYNFVGLTARAAVIRAIVGHTTGVDIP